jgi:hypothetical protein
MRRLRRAIEALRRPEQPEPPEEPDGLHFFDLARYQVHVDWDPSQPPPPGTPDHVIEQLGWHRTVWWQ